MPDKRIQLKDKKYNLLLTRVAYSSAALNLASTISRMVDINEKISMNVNAIDIISLLLSGVVLVGGIGHTNDIKFDIDEIEFAMEAEKEKGR